MVGVGFPVGFPDEDALGFCVDVGDGAVINPGARPPMKCTATTTARPPTTSTAMVESSVFHPLRRGGRGPAR